MLKVDSTIVIATLVVFFLGLVITSMINAFRKGHITALTIYRGASLAYIKDPSKENQELYIAAARLLIQSYGGFLSHKALNKIRQIHREQAWTVTKAQGNYITVGKSFPGKLVDLRVYIFNNFSTETFLAVRTTRSLALGILEQIDNCQV